MNQGTILGSQIGRWIILAALVVALGALLLTIRPVGAQDADAPPSIANAQTVFYYAEKGTGPVTTYSATDPEGRPIFWTLGGADAASFTIEGGALRFRSSPNFEGPTDRTNDEDGNGTVAANEGLANNIYKVTVRFSAGGEDGDPDPTDDYDGDDLDELDLTINVTNVNEPGAVAISSLQPQIGTQLEATLTDSDVQVGFGQWQWAGGPAKSGPFTPITSWVDRNLDPNAHTYRPVDDDLGKYLQVSVRYKDKVDDTVKTAQTESEYAVRKDIVTSNANPKFPDQRTLVGGTAINRATTWRYVPENSPAGTPVGARVTAFDDETSIDVITYSLSDGPTGAEGDAASFNIDQATGQITVAAGTRLNRADDVPAGKTTYSVTVTGTDGDGHSEDITVTITVVKVNEPPRIDRVYVGPDRVPTGHTAGDRVPTEMSHYELDRNNAPATVIDTNLDTEADTDTPTTIEPATYYATDPETDDITWSLEGDDAGQFTILPKTGPMATLAFGDGPDFEEGGREDKNKNNVYEVTIVATDSTLVNHDKLDVTVKVIDSTEDNKPGKVYLSNRQPEGASLLTASLDDPDKPITGPTWQWYRSDVGSADSPTTCGAVDTDGVFTPAAALIDDDGPVADAWEIIVGATSATYTPKWDADDDPDDDAGKCLRATATYTDWVAADPTMPDNPDTADVDESKLPEMAHGVSHNPVQVEDTDNKRPVFRLDPDIPASASADSYVIFVPENLEAIDIGILRDDDTDGVLDEVVAAIDDEATETTGIAPNVVVTPNPDAPRDSAGDDTLTYTLGGADATSFRISGSIQLPVSDEDNAGQLMTRGGLNFEKKREYKLTVTATDPTGDSATISVTVNVTDENDPLVPSGPVAKDYTENDTDAVGIYTATDEDINGITYTLVPIGDHEVFTVSSLDGTLTFKPRPDGKARPNYELPEDIAITGNADNLNSVVADNLYIVAVRARVAGTDEFDNTEATSFDGLAAQTTADRVHRIVRVRVLNENERPMFTLDEDTQGIKENPDDLLQDPRLNRGVGGNPAVASLDVGIPMIAVDDDNEVDADGNFPTLDEGEINEGHMVDGLTYTLSGTDAESFDIVRATGQILAVVKLDYETKDEYNVTVTATDTGHPSTGADRLSDSINVTIEVIDVEEVPVPSTLTITGDGSQTYAENSTDAVGEYEVTAFGDASANPRWTREGADAGHFNLTGSGSSRTLIFRSAPDYDAMADADSDNNYEVTLKVTDPSDNTITNTFGVTITVTDVEELGALSGLDSVSVMEGATAPLGTYTLTGGDGTSTVTWSLDGVDMDQFTLDGSQVLTFSSAPDFEAPADANDDNKYMVTVKASAGGETDMVEVEVMVDDVNELGALDGNASPSYAEDRMDAVETYTLMGGTMDDTATWTVSGDDADAFTITGGVLMFVNQPDQPDFEAPADAGGDNAYMVTVMASAGGEMEEREVTVTVQNVEEDGTVTLMPMRPSVGTAITATLEDPDMVMEDTVMWQWASADAMDGDFTDITDATMYTYTPVADDAGMYLKAMASYTDGYGADSAEMVTETAVAQLAVNGEPAVELLEGVTSVGTYEASGADNVAWSLTGDDAGDFSINGGQLTFGTAPDFENPADADMDNVYMVTVVATATVGTLMASQPVMVTVTDMDEDGMVTVMPMSAMVGTVLTATLDDPDTGVTVPAWQWVRSDDMNVGYSRIDDATMTTYTVADDDAGMYLRAVATYDDIHGMGKEVASRAVMVSAAEERPQAVQDYDTNGTAGIQIDEVFDAIDDYFDDGLSIDDLFEIIDAYFG